MAQTNGNSNHTGMPVMATAVRHEMTARDYIKVLFRQKWIILLTIVSVSLATYLGLQLQTPLYEAQIKMLLSAEKQIDSPYYRDIIAGRTVEPTLTQSEIVKSKPVLERTIAALGLYKRPIDYEKHFATPLKQKLIDTWVQSLHLEDLSAKGKEAMIYRATVEDLKRKISVEPIRDTNLFMIRVRDYSPIGAAIISNALSRAYVIFDLEQQYVDLQAKYTEKNPIVMQLKENIKKMEEGLSGQPLPNIDALGPATVKIVEQATPPLKPIGLPKRTLMILAFVLSIVLGFFLAYLIEFADQTFHSKNDLEDFLGVPVIACINRKKGLRDKALVKDVADTNRSPRATSYRILAQQILFMVKTKELKSILIASVHPSDDSALILSNVAIFLSKKLGMKTLLIDANLRRPRLHKMFSTSIEQGLSEILEGKIKPAQGVRAFEGKLGLIPAGHSHADPGILFDEKSFSAVLTELKSLYDVILVDGSDLRDFRDSALIAPAVDGVILVVGESTVRRQVVQFSVKHLRETKSRLIGVIMPNRHYLIPKFLYESV